MFDLGPEPGDLHEPPFGTNMAFRREVFSTYGEFRRDLGPQPGSEIRSEDTEFGMRVIAGGGRLWYEPRAVVYHEVSEKRLKPAYFLKWWFDKGRGEIREHGLQPGTRWFIGNVPLYLVRRVLVWTVRWLLSVRPGPRFSAKQSLWKLFGAIKECRYQAQSGGLKHSRLSDSATETRT
jgi:GT2 family glycosyltransferase